MDKVALLIGASNYEHPEVLKPLPSARQDVEAMRRVLLNPHMGGFTEAISLVDPDPMQMQEAIETLFRGRTKDDLVLLFFSGHGIKDDTGELYFATRLTRKTQRGELVKATAVPAQFVQGIMSGSRSKRQVVILDCCFSGAFDPTLQFKDDGSLDLLTQLGAEGRVVLTSSSSTQYSFEQTGAELSIYTRYLVEGIETGVADRDNDSKISARELHEYASDKVQETAPSMSPKIIVLKDRGFDIVIAKTRIADPKLKYRKEVEHYGSQGQISPVGRIILNKQRVQLGLSEAGVIEIEEEVLRPYRERLENLQQYREALTAAVQSEYPLGSETLREFSDLQAVMGLREQDTEPIHAEIAAQITAETEGYEQKLLQYEREFTRAIQKEYPFNISARESLRQLQQSLKLKDEETVSLETRLTEQRQQEYQANKQQYEQEFLKAIQAEYPLNQQLRQELKHFQQSLGLKDEDAELIEKPVAAQKEAEFQKHQADSLKQQEAEQARKQQETEQIRKRQEAEQARKQQEAEKLRKRQEAEQARKQQEAEKRRRQQEAKQTKPQSLQSDSSSPAAPRKSRWLAIAGVAVVVTSLAVGTTYWAQTRARAKQNSAIEQLKSLQAGGEYEKCVAQAQALTSNKEILPTAMNLLAECQFSVAKQLAESGHLMDAINIASRISPNAPTYQQAQAQISSWAGSILSLAEKQYRAGKLGTAVAMAQAIPEGSTRAKAQKSIEQWKKEWQANENHVKAAKDALGKKQWQAAIDAANKVTTEYWKQQVAQIIQKANSEIAAAEAARQEGARQEAARQEAARQERARQQAASQNQQPPPRSNPITTQSTHPAPLREEPGFIMPE